MKKIYSLLILLFLFSYLWINGCSSPSDVPANRVVTTKIDENDPINQNEPKISISRENLIYDQVLLNSSKLKDITVFNISNKPLTISEINVKKYSKYFSVWSPDLPITLAPYGHDNSSQRIFIKFSADTLGSFEDEISFNNMDKPVLKINAVVPTIECSDIDFGDIRISSSKMEIIKVKNNSNITGRICSYVLVDPEGVFEFMTILNNTPIEKGTPTYIYVRFNPKEEKPYNGRIEFYIDGTGIIDNISEITGRGTL